MGEARRRGTFEERKAQAIARNKKLRLTRKTTPNIQPQPTKIRPDLLGYLLRTYGVYLIRNRRF